MTHQAVRRTLALTTALGLTVAVPAFAETASSQSKDTSAPMAEIVVTARRVEERLEDVPISITVYNQEQLANRNIFNSGDLGTYVPSLATDDQFGPEKASFAIRGFTQEGKTAPSVAVYFADVVEPRSNGGTTSGNGVGVGELFDMQNVEVLKGPQGTLFGRNTTGGAILFVPQKPTDKFEGYVEGSAGDYNMHRIQAVLNVPINDKLRVRAGVDWQQRDGYLNNESGIGPSRFGNVNYVSARLSMVADLSDNLENYTIGTYSKSDTYGVVPKLLVCDTSHSPISSPLAPLACAQIARQGAGLWDVENNDPTPFERVEQWRIINTTTWEATANLTVKNILSYAQYREASSFSLFGDDYFIPLPGGGTIPETTIQLYPGTSGYNSEESTLTEELQFQGKLLDDKLHWQAGGYLESSKPLGFNSGLTDIFLNCTNIYTNQCSGAGDISDSLVKDTFNDKGVYAQTTYDLTDRLNLTTGIRYTMDRITDFSEDANIVVPAPGTGIFICQNRVLFNGGSLAIPDIVASAAGCPELFKIKSNRPTWLIDLDYKPMDDLLTYAKWARGYREGGINPNNVGLETWGPEKVDTFEIGGKTSFHGAVPGYFNIDGFYNNFRNQQLAANSVVAPAFADAISPAQPIVNAGKSRMWGIEIDTSARLFQGFTADAAYTYLNTKLISITPPPTPIYYSALIPTADVGQPLALSPKNRFTLTGTYTFPIDSRIGKPWMSATFTHTDANRAVAPAASPLYLLPATNLLNLNAGLKQMFDRPIELSFFMTNATNQGYLLHPLGALYTIGAEGGHPDLPRMFGFRLRYSFGS
jgi:iron complex outermembrane receptor protein